MNETACVTDFQVSVVAFSILMDYFSSIPVTKKNLVTQQTQLLVMSMTFCVCTQVTSIVFLVVYSVEKINKVTTR